MKYPYLKKWVRALCEAAEKPYAPSVFQLHEYCRGKDHRKCPLFMGEAIRFGAMDRVSCA